MFTLVGRGCFYVLVGIVVTVANPWPNFFVGIWTVGTGLASLYYGYKANEKLMALRFALMDEVAARQTFSRFDSNGDGKVTVPEFASLLAELQCELSHHELEAAVALVSNDGERLISADAFVAWYNEHVMLKEPL